MVVVEAAMEDSWCVKYFLILFAQSFFVASCITSPATIRLTKMVRAGWDRAGAGDAQSSKTVIYSPRCMHFADGSGCLSGGRSNDLMWVMWMTACCNEGDE